VLKFARTTYSLVVNRFLTVWYVQFKRIPIEIIKKFLSCADVMRLVQAVQSTVILPAATPCL